MLAIRGRRVHGRTRLAQEVMGKQSTHAIPTPALTFVQGWTDNMAR